MIKISVSTEGAQERYGVDAAYNLIAECGFDAVDANIDQLASWPDIAGKKINPALLGPNADPEIFKPWKDASETYTLPNFQAHAPFPSYLYNEPELNDAIADMLQNIIRGCDYINCRNLIVHPFFHFYDHVMDPQTEHDVNIERYTKLIPVAKQYGVNICLENMFLTRRGKVYAGCCSDIPTACRYIDELNAIAGEKLFGFCLDTGHLLLIGGDVKQAMLTLGDRLFTFHVHDNNGFDDQHLAPYMGVQDWDRFTQGLAACGFDSTMNFETGNIWNVIDNQLCPSMMRFIAETGRMFADRAAKG